MGWRFHFGLRTQLTRCVLCVRAPHPFVSSYDELFCLIRCLNLTLEVYAQSPWYRIMRRIIGACT
eukprot:COSAG02_NODE_53808_length_299_cov_1.250000_1_plen_64_part_10